jgi:hypothetical protein
MYLYLCQMIKITMSTASNEPNDHRIITKLLYWIEGMQQFVQPLESFKSF